MKNNTVLKISFSLINRVLILFILLLLIAFATVAWMSMNRHSEADGVLLSTEQTPNLIIAKTAEKISTMTANECSDSNFEIDYDIDRTEMLPSTHDWTLGNTTGLKYVKNTNDIEFASGVAKDGKTYDYEKVDVDNDSLFYIDYSAYIASADLEMTNVKLVASVYCDKGELTDKEHFNALTVDFYVNSVSESNYIKSIAVKNQDTQNAVFNLVNNKIPCNTDGYIHIIARCYFDGELYTDNTNTITYINSKTINTEEMALKILFSAEDISD